MKTFYMKSTNILNAFRWVAKTLTVLLFVLLAIILVAEGTRPWVKLTTMPFDEFLMFFSLVVALAGLLLAWKWEGFGGMLTLAGLLAFSIVDYSFSGKITWNIWIIGIPAVLFLLNWWFTYYTRD